MGGVCICIWLSISAGISDIFKGLVRNSLKLHMNYDFTKECLEHIRSGEVWHRAFLPIAYFDTSSLRN